MRRALIGAVCALLGFAGGYAVANRSEQVTTVCGTHSTDRIDLSTGRPSRVTECTTR